MQDCCLGVEDLNSGPHVSTASTLLTEPSFAVPIYDSLLFWIIWEIFSPDVILLLFEVTLNAPFTATKATPPQTVLCKIVNTAKQQLTNQPLSQDQEGQRLHIKLWLQDVTYGKISFYRVPGTGFQLLKIYCSKLVVYAFVPQFKDVAFPETHLA